MEVTKENMKNFLRDVFRQDPNPGALTVRQLRTKYLNHVQLEELDRKQLGMFSAAVDGVFQEFNDRQSESNSEEEDKTNAGSRNSTKRKKRMSNKATDDDDDDDDFRPNKTRPTGKLTRHTPRARKRIRRDQSSSSEDDFKPEKNRSKKAPKKPINTQPSESSSDETPLAALKDAKDDESGKFGVKDNCKNNSTNVIQEKLSEQVDNSAGSPVSPSVIPTANDKEKSNTSKKASEIESSEDESLGDLKLKLDGSKRLQMKSDLKEEEEKEDEEKSDQKKGLSGQETDSGTEDIGEKGDSISDDGSHANDTKKKVVKKKASKKAETEEEEKEEDDDEEESKSSKKSKSQLSDDDDPKIMKFKRFIRTAGLRVVYAKIFEGCRSKKAKIQKLVDLLEEAGLKGKPTLEKCKKLRKKRETMREVAELDQSNILETTGRPRRNLQPGAFRPPSPVPVREDSPPPVVTKKIFSRLKDIVDSEESSE